MSYRDNILDITRLRLHGEFEEQVDQLLFRVRLTRTEVEELEDLYQDVEDVMRKCWTGCRLYPFGSIVTGLGIKTSDVDLFVDLPAWTKKKDVNPVYIARKCMRALPRLFGDVQAVPTAKVPLVKCYHIPRHRYCDINFNSYGGIRNSKLIAFLLHMDYRALPLAVIVKYWSKVHNLTGTNLMPNYTLTMMVIFYLQQVNILPPVCDLQKDIEECVIEHWNTAFQEDFFFEFRNRESLYVLLGGFYDYYKSFKFQEYVISPFMGKPIPRSQFVKTESLPAEYELYKTLIRDNVYKPMKLHPKICVQDPFEHSRNCGAPIFDKLALKVQHFINECAIKFEVVPKQNFLEAILIQIPYQEPAPKKKKTKNYNTARVGKVVKAYRNPTATFKANLRKQTFSNAVHHLYHKYQQQAM